MIGIFTNIILNTFYTYSCLFHKEVHILFLIFILLYWFSIIISLTKIEHVLCISAVSGFEDIAKINKIINYTLLILSVSFSLDIVQEPECSYGECMIYEDSLFFFISILSISIFGNITLGFLFCLNFLNFYNFAITRIKIIIKAYTLSTSKIYYLNTTMTPPADTTCYICLEDCIDYIDYTENKNVEEWKVLYCKHIFHSKCIDEWLINCENNTCPTCRKIVSFV